MARNETRIISTAESADGRHDWMPFIGRALALICLDKAGLDEGTLLQRADFLMGLGLPRKEAAVVLGSTDESLRVQFAKRSARLKSGKG